MLFRIWFLVVSFVALIGRAKSLKCYSCHDDSEYGNCHDVGWTIINDCNFGCVTYQAEVKEKIRTASPKYFGRYRRGCAGQGGCEEIKQDLNEAWDYNVPQFDCQECNKDLCNDRANHPGYSFKKPLIPIKIVKTVKCYFCSDESDKCHGRDWPITDCDAGCVTYQAKIRKKYSNPAFPTYFTWYIRGCAHEEGCNRIKENLDIVSDYGLSEFDCQECNEDKCNNRANHPGYSFKNFSNI